MPIISCPILNCQFATGDVDSDLANTLLKLHARDHNDPPSSNAAKVERVKRPNVKSAGSSEDWNYFLSRWSEYKAATKITGPDIVLQLLECCDEQLRKDLTRNAGGSLSNKSEEEVTTAIKSLAVREENCMVARMQLFNMRQDRDEAIRNFGARLRGQAGICKFQMECPNCSHQVNYTDAILRDALTRGLGDTDIQLDLLSDKNQDMKLEEVFQFIEAKESGKRSASQLQSKVQGAEAAQSSYRRSQKPQAPQAPQAPQNNSEPCGYCGQLGHGNQRHPSARKNVCPAFGHSCTYCGIRGHYDRMCRKSKRPDLAQKSTRFPGSHRPPGASSVEEFEGAVFDNLCSAASSQLSSTNSITLDHHIYDNMCDRWIRQASKPQPVVNIHIQLCREDYKVMGYKPADHNKHCTVPAMADTGCQSCLAGLKVVQRLGLSKQNLIPVTMQMHAANNAAISIIGAAILRYSGMTKDGELLETRQVTYITDSSDKLFLSREACVALGMISHRFPQIGESAQINTDTSSDPVSEHEGAVDPPATRPNLAPCGCPTRTPVPPPPEQLPYAATDDNREKLQQFLVDYYKSSTFNICPHQPLPLMDVPPMHMTISQDATPVAHHKAIPVPLHWRDEVKAGLDRDVRLGVLEPVPIGEPVTWCHRMVVCAKKDGTARRTVDFQALNKFATRETHHTQSPFHQARSVPQNKKKTVLDAWNGYHSVPLHVEDRHLTTFISPWGRYRYCVAPQGYIASGDAYTRRYDEIVAGIPDNTKCVDDALLWADTTEESFWRTVNWLDVCGRNGVTLNPPPKFVFAADNVEFAGFEVTMNEVRPCQKYIEAILDFPTPTNITDMRSWFGLVNQVSYAFSMTKLMEPFRKFLKPNTPFEWNEQLESIFSESKRVIAKEIEKGIRIYDKTLPTCLTTDWSKTGIGFWLFQKHCRCPGRKPFCCKDGWQITLVGSRFTHDAESRYAPVEGEALAVADALDKARFFVSGCHDLIIATDHKPLLKLFGDRSLEAIPNPRLRNLKEKTLRYKFEMVYIPGAKHKATDAVSRHPTGSHHPAMMELPDDVAPVSESLPLQGLPTSFLAGIRMEEDQTEVEDYESDLVNISVAALHAYESVTWDRVRLHTASDPDMHRLCSTIETGWPSHRQELPPSIRDYHQYHDDLYTVDGVVVYKERIVIPTSLRQEVLNTLHSAHQGVTSMMARAEATVFWPGMTSAINDMRARCNDCNRMSPSQPSAPPVAPTPPSYPFQCICADYFDYAGTHYLVMVDRYSNWPIVERGQGGAQGLITALRRVFVTFGICEELSSDGGTEFTASATQKFLKDWGVSHRLSSVAYPHSNCRAEIGVKTVKRLIVNNTGPRGELDTEAFQRAILQYRNTPDRDTKLSPAECVFGRPIRDFIPILPGRYRPHTTWKETLLAREEALRNRHQQAAERWSRDTKRLPPLIVGDLVRLQNQTGPHPLKWDRTGRVIEVKQFDQYVVKVDGSGRVTLRNRKFLRKYVPVHPPLPPFSDFTRSVPGPVVPTAQTFSPQPAISPTSSGPEAPGSAPPSDPPVTAPDPHDAPDLPSDVPVSVSPPDDRQESRQGDSGRTPAATRMLTRILPHNAPGLAETTPTNDTGDTTGVTLRRSSRNTRD